MPLVQGFASDRFTPVSDVFAASLESGADLGASVCVIHQGNVVCDLWGGYVDEARTIPWDRDTLVNVWSTTKTMTFLVALMLADRGELDFHAPVARYWPEFAAANKADTEVRHLLSHSAGLAGWDHLERHEDLADWDLATSLLAAQAPWWDDPRQSGYHALTQGFLIGEVVRRITGTTIGQFFASEVAAVLDADFHIGLAQSEERRVSPVVATKGVDSVPSDRGSIAYRALSSPPLEPTVPNHRWWRAAEIPAANGHGNARSVALIQQIIANNGHANGHRFFSERTGASIFEVQTSGVDLVLGVEMNYGLGYGLSSATTPIGPRSCYWGGYGGSVIIMDQDQELTVAYAMNLMRVGLIGDTRGTDLALAAVLAAFA